LELPALVLAPVLAQAPSKQHAPALRPVRAQAQQVLPARAQPPLLAGAQGRRPEPPRGPPKQHALALDSLPARARRPFAAQPSASRPAEPASSQPQAPAPSCTRGRGPAQPRQAQRHGPGLEADLEPDLAPDSAAARKPRRASTGHKVRRCHRRHGRSPPRDTDTERRPADHVSDGLLSTSGDRGRHAHHQKEKTDNPAYAPIRPSLIKR
jgi:hypothetical protein